MAEPVEVTNLVKHYVNICNTAITRNEGSALYGPIVALLEELASGTAITIEVTGTGDGRAPCYLTRFIDGEFTPVREGVHEPSVRMELDKGFLEDVVRNSDDYIANPQKLSWSWLTGQAS